MGAAVRTRSRKNNFLEKEFLFFLRVLEIVVSIFWMEVSVSVESCMD